MLVKGIFSVMAFSPPQVNLLERMIPNFAAAVFTRIRVVKSGAFVKTRHSELASYLTAITNVSFYNGGNENTALC
jgi:hypothetical protein